MDAGIPRAFIKTYLIRLILPGLDRMPPRHGPPSIA